MKNNLSVIILAAGKGTRMKSDLPKVLHKIDGSSMIRRVIQTSQNLNPEKIIIVIGYKHELVESHLKNLPIEFAYQFVQKGTGHAIGKCKNYFKEYDGDILILSGDVPLLSYKTLQSLCTYHRNTNSKVTILTADLSDASGYGRIIRNDRGNFEKIIEHKDATNIEKEINEINTGIYIFDSKTLFSELPKIRNENIQGEYYLPDVLFYILENNDKVSLLKTKYIYEIQGVNNEQQLQKLNEID